MSLCGPLKSQNLQNDACVRKRSCTHQYLGPEAHSVSSNLVCIASSTTLIPNSTLHSVLTPVQRAEHTDKCWTGKTNVEVVAQSSQGKHTRAGYYLHILDLDAPPGLYHGGNICQSGADLSTKLAYGHFSVILLSALLGGDSRNYYRYHGRNNFD